MMGPIIRCIVLALICESIAPVASLGQVRTLDKPLRQEFHPPGYVAGDDARESFVTFEDIQPLSPAMKRATATLRAGDYDKAIREFRAIQASSPTDPLAFRGELQAVARLDHARENYRTWEELKRGYREAGPAIRETIRRFQDMLARAPNDAGRRAALHYALGHAIMNSRSRKGWVAEPLQDLGPEPGEHFEKALRLNPGMVVAHFALALYYEHQQNPNGCKGTEARRHYDAALALRPDLACKIRFLHALTWDRPGYVTPQEYARVRAIGYKIPEDQRRMPEKAIAECKRVIRDFPDFVPAYERIAKDYEWPLGNKEAARKYRELAAAAKARAQAGK